MSNEMKKAIVEAFKAGARWSTANGADYYVELDYDAEFYSHTGVVRERGGIVTWPPRRHR